MELYRKYRASNLSGILGNETSVKAIQSIIDKKDRPHTFLFVGPAGCGKTTLAYILAKAFNLGNVTEYNSADYRGIDSVREFSETLKYAPLTGTQGFIFEEGHKLTNDAQEALLKPVENCPEHTYLFFTTTDASKLNAALKTRMVIINVEPLRDDQISELVTSVCGKEDIKLEDDVVKHIASSAYGSPRRALTMLEKVIGLSHEDQLKVSGYAEEADTFAIDLCRIVLRKGKWEDVAAILSKLAVEPEAARRAVLGYLRAIMLKKDSPKAFVIAKHFTDNYYNTGNAGLVLSCYAAWMEFNTGE